jgi:hypothetical protein
MRPDRLERLRTQFGWPSVDTTPIGLSQPGCAEPLTLLGAPANPNVIGQGRDAACEIGLIGVPMDLGVTNRPGARFGPRALRAIERVGPFHHVHKIEPMQRRRVADTISIFATPTLRRPSVSLSPRGAGHWRSVGITRSHCRS